MQYLCSMSLICRRDVEAGCARWDWTIDTVLLQVSSITAAYKPQLCQYTVVQRTYSCLLGLRRCGTHYLYSRSGIFQVRHFPGPAFLVMHFPVPHFQRPRLRQIFLPMPLADVNQPEAIRRFDQSSYDSHLSALLSRPINGLQNEIKCACF